MDLRLSSTLSAAYNEQYSDEATEWRELGGKYKAENILRVCQGQHFRSVLECGAGEGSILKFLDEAGVFEELYALEISESGISQIKKRQLPRLKEVRQFDGYQIPYPDQSFDTSYCSHVLEHVEHPRLLLRELRRVSRFQVFEVPLDYSVQVDQRVKHFLSYGHINIYTPSLFRFLLKSEGFEILREHLSELNAEVIRYYWYKGRGRKNKVVGELQLKLRPLVKLLRRLWLGKARYQEYAYSAYTCLTRGVGELKIF
jgi:ubiquinone/menaquinone biosynthesis C-methylase UbiE